MIAHLERIINNNPGERFVVHILNKDEHDQILEYLLNDNYEYTIPLEGTKEIMERFGVENSYDYCVRIDSSQKLLAVNPSPKHWIDCGYDVIFFNGQEFDFEE